MADMTFGVKVSEEMKNELSELMKTTDLTGKEFMSMLLATYKLEQNKVKKDFLSQDIGELQRLLQRVQHLYLNISERSELLIEEKLKEKDEEVRVKEEEKLELTGKINTLVQAAQEKEVMLENIKQDLFKKEQRENELCIILEEQKEQIKQGRMLSQKYVEEIDTLKEKIERLERFEVEIAERNEENERLKERNDTLASDLWFAQRELEKIAEEKEKSIYQLKEEQTRLEENYRLNMENQLLQQKLDFTKQIEILKEENFKIREVYTNQINDYMSRIKKENEEKEEKTK